MAKDTQTTTSASYTTITYNLVGVIAGDLITIWDKVSSGGAGYIQNARVKGTLGLATDAVITD